LLLLQTNRADNHCVPIAAPLKMHMLGLAGHAHANNWPRLR
jgi:hypothetical protein